MATEMSPDNVVALQALADWLRGSLGDFTQETALCQRAAQELTTLRQRIETAELTLSKYRQQEEFENRVLEYLKRIATALETRHGH